MNDTCDFFIDTCAFCIGILSSLIRMPLILMLGIGLGMIGLFTHCNKDTEESLNMSSDITLTSLYGTIEETGVYTYFLKDIPYNVSLEAFKEGITVADGASYEIYEEDGFTFAETLSSGCILLIIAEDGFTFATYYLVVLPAPSNANLSNITLSERYLTPVFSPEILNYEAMLPMETQEIIVYPTAQNPEEVQIKVNDELVESGSASQAIPLVEKETTITLLVTAGDAISQQTYTIQIIKGFHTEIYFKSANSDMGDGFGKAVAMTEEFIAISANLEDSGETAIMQGISTSDDNSISDAGAVYIYKQSSNQWVQNAYVKASNQEAGDNFGYALAVSGTRLAVSAKDEDSNQSSITNGDEASTNNEFTSAGAVYIFNQIGEAWTQEAYIKPTNSGEGDCFGSAIAMDGTRVVVAAKDEGSNQDYISSGDTASQNDSLQHAGAVYVFAYQDDSWRQEAYIKPSHPDSWDYFGWDVALCGDTLAVSSIGEASNESGISNGDTGSDDDSVPNAGAVYIFQRTGATWVQTAYIKAPYPDAEDKFGYSLALTDSTLLVGAPYEDSNWNTVGQSVEENADNTLSNAGAAFLYTNNGSEWILEAYIKPPNPSYDDQFGSRVAAIENTIIISAVNEDSSLNYTINEETISIHNNDMSNSGAVYVFHKPAASWVHQAYLKAPNVDKEDHFGYSLAFTGNALLIGVPEEDSNRRITSSGTLASSNNEALNSGAAYLIR